ncbi:MAG: radical SAM protein [Chloroflexota bacterium]|nr:radical SAM protein [Chloroflexota bacterium]
MTRVSYTATPCKSALNRVRGMPFAWSLNPYRGCTHGCHYCYARATHAHLGLDAGLDFTQRIFVKSNVVDVLRRELGARSWRREEVAIGTATDPYQPCEGRFALMPGVLQTFVEFHSPVSIVTKSTLVWRDHDHLASLQAVAGARVSFTITTLDPALWRALEPGTPPPRKRLEIMRRLVEAGVPCGVFLAPVVPGITDSPAALAAVAEAAHAHGASWLWASPLRLAPLVKEHFLGWLGEFRPDLLARYAQGIPGANTSPQYQAWLERQVAQARLAAGFAPEAPPRPRPVSPAPATQQLALAL